MSERPLQSTLVALKARVLDYDIHRSDPPIPRNLPPLLHRSCRHTAAATRPRPPPSACQRTAPASTFFCTQGCPAAAGCRPSWGHGRADAAWRPALGQLCAAPAAAQQAEAAAAGSRPPQCTGHAQGHCALGSLPGILLRRVACRIAALLLHRAGCLCPAASLCRRQGLNHHSVSWLASSHPRAPLATLPVLLLLCRPVCVLG